jgi:hypothetical protein
MNNKKNRRIVPASATHEVIDDVVDGATEELLSSSEEDEESDEANVSSLDEDTRHRERRKIFWICAAIKEGRLILDPVEGESSDDASERFRAKYGISPAKILTGDPKINAGWAVVKTTGRVESQAVTVSTVALRRQTGDTFVGEFKGWKIIGSGLKATSVVRQTTNGGQKVYHFDDNELLNIDVIEEAIPESKGKIHKPKLKKLECVIRGNITNLRMLSEKELADFAV